MTCSFGNCEASLSTVLLEHGLGQGFLHKSRAVIEETVWACADLKCQEEECISPMSGWGSCMAEGRVTDTPRVAPTFTVPPFYFQCHSPQSTTQPGQRMPETQCDAWQTQRGPKCHSRPVSGGDLVLFGSLDLPESEHVTFLPESKEMFHPRKGPKRKIAKRLGKQGGNIQDGSYQYARISV